MTTTTASLDPRRFGRVCMRRSTVLIFIVMCGIGHGAELARSPSNPALRTWEPYWSIFGKDEIYNAILHSVAPPHAQGYVTAPRFRDRVEYDDNFDMCTRQMFDIMWGGIIYFNTHGNIGRIIAITTKTKAKAEEWVASGTDNNDMVVRRSANGWLVRVYAPWFARNWRPRLDRWRSIVFGQACMSVSVLPSMGGRVGFGYEKGTNQKKALADAHLLFNRMNGTLAAQARRRADDAIDGGGYTAGFRKVGNGATTLCPSVVNPCRSNAQPWGPGAGPAGEGFVALDTAIDGTHAGSPERALTYQVVTGEVTLDNFRFRRTAEGLIDGILFRYHSDCIGDFKVRMTLNARRVIPDTSIGFQYLDGNDGQENQEKEGEAPHADDFVWSFED